MSSPGNGTDVHANLDQLEDGKDVDDKIVVDRFFGLAGATVIVKVFNADRFEKEMILVSMWSFSGAGV